MLAKYLDTKAKRLCAKIVVPLLFIVHIGLLEYSSRIHFFAYDEVGHYGAAITHWQEGHFNHYRVNPPLVRFLAGAFVDTDSIKYPQERYDIEDWQRRDFGLGNEIIGRNNAKALKQLPVMRRVSIFFSCLGAFVVLLWATQLFGFWAGLAGLAIWSFSPNMIAHGSMITPDVAATSCGLLTLYMFRHWFNKPGWKTASFLGLCLGLTLLTKFTWVILVPLLPVLWLAAKKLRGESLCWRGFQQLIASYFIALFVMNAGYGFEKSFTKLGEFTFLSSTFKGENPSKVGNRFRGTLFEHVPVPLPRNVLVGIDRQKSDFEKGAPSYLNGEWSQRKGWYSYYLYGLLYKVPAGFLLLFVWALVYRIHRRASRIDVLDELLICIPAGIVFLLVSFNNGFNHHLRYVLPIFPFAILFAVRLFSTNGSSSLLLNKKSRFALGSLVALGAISSLSVYPHSLSYFNQIAGGPENGAQRMLDSNLDWGQDLLLLRKWLDQNPDVKADYKMAYYGAFNPLYIGMKFGKIDLAPRKGWHIVSTNYVKGHRDVRYDDKGKIFFKGGQYYPWFDWIDSVHQIGYSIRIFYIDEKMEKDLNLKFADYRNRHRYLFRRYL